MGLRGNVGMDVSDMPCCLEAGGGTEIECLGSALVGVLQGGMWKEYTEADEDMAVLGRNLGNAMRRKARLNRRPTLLSRVVEWI